jgi:DeoR/GlpR family transcriptional regulator of sugar metabolism
MRLAEIVRDRRFVSVPSIADELQVSEMTIRRDLSELEQKGRVVRTHGGAVAPENPADPVLDRDEPAFDSRLAHNRAVKERIAAAAFDLVASSKTLALDVGTTTYLLAARLVARTNLMIFTNSLRIAALLNTGSNEVHVPGGRVRKDEMSVHGPDAVAQFEKLWFDIAFIGVSGATRDGLFDYSADDSELKRVYLRRSERTVVLCDSQKFHRMSLVRVAGLSEIDVLVTDSKPPPDIMDALAAAQVEVWIAPELSTGAP